MIVAIDGPAGAGKSTVAREVAARLGFRYLDTGAMYRAVTSTALACRIDPTDGEALAGMLGAIDLQARDGQMFVDGRDISSEIRSEDVTSTVSVVAAHPVVRSALVPLQRAAAAEGDTIVEGRDIGTVVFPDADLKVFLTASTEERAKRRARQLEMPRESVDRIARALQERDSADASRPTSPLVKPDDAHVLDTTALGFEEVVEAIIDLVRAAR